MKSFHIWQPVSGLMEYTACTYRPNCQPITMLYASTAIRRIPFILSHSLCPRQIKKVTWFIAMLCALPSIRSKYTCLFDAVHMPLGNHTASRHIGNFKSPHLASLLPAANVWCEWTSILDTYTCVVKLTALSTYLIGGYNGAPPFVGFTLPVKDAIYAQSKRGHRANIIL